MDPQKAGGMDWRFLALDLGQYDPLISYDSQFEDTLNFGFDFIY